MTIWENDICYLQIFISAIYLQNVSADIYIGCSLVSPATWEIIGYNWPTIALEKLWKLTEGLRLNYEVWSGQRKKLFFLVDWQQLQTIRKVAAVHFSPFHHFFNISPLKKICFFRKGTLVLFGFFQTFTHLSTYILWTGGEGVKKYKICVQGGWGGWPTGNRKRLSSCQAQLGQATWLAVA